jgi:ABC-type Mn2+/Zn2+ transport system permease subunit
MMLEMFQYEYMQRALISGILIGTLCAVIGVYVVLKGMSFIGAGISHASLGGIAIGVALGINPIWTAAGFAIIIGWGIALVSKYGNVKEDTAVGIFFASAEALGIMIIAMMHNYQVDLLSYLFGSIISVTKEDVWLTGVAAVLVLAIVFILYKDLMFIIFDPEQAQIGGLPAGKLYFVLITLISVTIVMSIKVVGIVLVSALIVTPAAAAYQLTENFKKMMLISVIIGVGSSILGLVLSDMLKIPSGPAIVLLATITFFICLALSPRRKMGIKR